uniref:Uncharacterized protein n=1 Tax=Caenorhabditis japonica TaxID=281687 RepID=A0A8R1ERM1_CAEJA
MRNSSFDWSELSAFYTEYSVANDKTKKMIVCLWIRLVSSNFHNAEVARLQVSIRNAQVQEELIKQQSMIIREELKDAQKENTQNVLNLEELELMHKSLLTDYSRLQQLHNLLTTDYDKIKRQCIIMEKELHSIPKKRLKNRGACA